MTAPVYVGASAAVSGSSNSVNVRTDVGIPGDLLILALHTSNQAPPVDPPSGWTALASSPQGSGTPASAGAIGLYIYYRWADTATAAAGATVASGDSGDHNLGRVWAFRGVNRVAPFNAQNGGTAASSSSYSNTGVTTTVNDCLVFDIQGDAWDNTGARWLSGPTNANLTGYTNPSEGWSTTAGSGGGFDVAYGVMATAGPTGASTGTLNAAATQAFYKIALAPAKGPWIAGLASSVGSTSNTSASWPTVHQAYDIGVLFVETAGGETISTPSGWTEFTASSKSSNTGTNGTRLSMYWCRATSSSEAAAPLSDAGDHVIGKIMTLRGCAASGVPYSVNDGGSKGTASTAVSVPGVTTTFDDQLVVYAVTRDNDLAPAEFSGWANANLAAFVEVIDEGQVFGNGGGFGIAAGVLGSAGATGTATASTVNSVENAYIVAAFGGVGSVSTGHSWARVIG